MSSAEAINPKQTNHDVRDLISTLTSRLTNHKPGTPGTSVPGSREDGELGASIITLAGTNTGATMKRDVLDHPSKVQGYNEKFSADDHQPEGSWDAYVNSNFQAVNNSIMLDASYTSNDPGVHMEIQDNVSEIPAHKNGRKGLRKGKEPAHGNLHSNLSH